MPETAEQKYTKELKKARYSVEELEETLHTGKREDILLAYERICEINKTLETATNLVKDAMLDSEKSLEEVRNWSQIRKEELRPIREFWSKLKGKLDEFAKRNLHQREEDLFKEKLELEMVLTKKKAEEEMARPQAVKLQKHTITPFKGDCKDWLTFGNSLWWK